MLVDKLLPKLLPIVFETTKVEDSSESVDDQVWLDSDTWVDEEDW